MYQKNNKTTINNAEDIDLVVLMYSLIEYSSNYSETIGSLWFYFKDQATDFKANISVTDNFKSLKYKAKLLGNKEDRDYNAANGILKNAIIAVSLKYLSNFWRSIEMPLINCKVELKFRWTKHYIFSVASTGNVNGNNDNDNNNNIFTIRDTQLFVPVVTLSARDNQKLSKLLTKGSKRSVYWNEYKTKTENKNMPNEYRNFLESNFAGVNRLFVLVYTDENNNAKRFNAQKYYLSKEIIKNYNVIINGKKIYDQPIDSDIKRYEKIRITTGCLLDYDYIKNHYQC